MVKKLLSYVKEYKLVSFLTPVAMFLEVLMETIIPLVMAKIIDNGLQANDVSYVVRLGVLMILLALMSLFFGIIGGFFGAKASAGFAKNLRQAVYEKIQEFSFNNIDKFQTSSLITRMTTDITSIQQSYQMIIRMGVRAPMTMIISFFMAYGISSDLSFIFVVAIPFIIAFIIVMMVKTMSRFKVMFEKYDLLNRTTQENLTAIRVVKSFVREDHEIEKFDKAASDIYNTSIAAEKMFAFANPVMTFMMYMVMMVICWFASSKIVFGELSTGNFMTLLTYSMSVLSSLLMVSMFFVMISMSFAAMKRVYEVLNEEVDLKNPENPIYEVKDGSVEFNDVSFSYYKDEDKLHLENINLKIPSGITVGVIGGTGDGKSTLVSLIARLYDVTKGCVKVGGLDVRNYDIESLRKEVSMVLQKNVLFSGTIKENLRWGDENASDEEIIRACKLACADEFIESFPDKYDTHIEQGGSNVSGGQKQRLCIARALLSKPKILILDDSTSAVDMKTDAMIRKAFREEIPDTTKIIIAQRVSSIEDADLIIVMNEGKIIAQGNHDELMNNCSIYKEIYDTQTRGGIINE